MDGEKLYRCPLRPFKDDPKLYSELFSLYSFADKGIMAEPGAYYDQPNAYLEALQELQGAVSDSYAVSEEVAKGRAKESDKSIDKLKSLGFNITKKK